MTTHQLKVHPQFWPATDSGDMSFTVRRDDRSYKVGDTVVLREFDPQFGFVGVGGIVRRVSCIMRHEDFPAAITEGYCVLGLRRS